MVFAAWPQHCLTSSSGDIPMQLSASSPTPLATRFESPITTPSIYLSAVDCCKSGRITSMNYARQPLIEDPDRDESSGLIAYRHCGCWCSLERGVTGDYYLRDVGVAGSN